MGLGVRRYGDRGWCGAPKHVDPMARHVHDMRARRRDGRTARPPHHALLVSARGRCGVVPPPEAAPGWSMVKFGGGGGSSHPRRWLGAQWAGLSPGSGAPPRAARGALRGRRIRAGPVKTAVRPRCRTWLAATRGAGPWTREQTASRARRPLAAPEPACTAGHAGARGRASAVRRGQPKSTASDRCCLCRKQGPCMAGPRRRPSG